MNIGENILSNNKKWKEWSVVADNQYFGNN